MCGCENLARKRKYGYICVFSTSVMLSIIEEDFDLAAVGVGARTESSEPTMN